LHLVTSNSPSAPNARPWHMHCHLGAAFLQNLTMYYNLLRQAGG